jgi:hypothetical protein
MPLSPGDGARNVPGRGPLLLRAPSRLADFRGSTQLATAGISCGPEAAGGPAGDHDTGEARSWTTDSVLGCLNHDNACERA